MMTITKIKKTARERLKGKWGVAIGANLLVILVIAAVIVLSGIIPFIGSVVFPFLTAPITVCNYWYFLALSRDEKPQIDYLFSGYRNQDFSRIFLAVVLINLFTFLWSLLFIIPGIIKFFSYKQTFFILRENPDMSALDAITESKHMMQGHKSRLFGLMLSFWFWYAIPLIVIFTGFYISFYRVNTDSFAVNTSMVYYNSTQTEALSADMIIGLLLIAFGFLLNFLRAIFINPYFITARCVFYDDLYQSTTVYKNEQTPKDNTNEQPSEPLNDDNELLEKSKINPTELN